MNNIELEFTKMVEENKKTIYTVCYFEFVRKRKMFAGLDEVLKQIKELRKEPQC